MKVLLVSNGAGEDAIATRIAACLEGARAQALPLVGAGEAYQGKVEVVGPRRRFASGGLVLESWRNLARDLGQGLILHHLRQLRFLRALRGRYAVTVAVGDLFPVVMAGLAGLRPLLFVGTAKSVWHHAYSPLEVLVLRLFTCQTLTRDEPTAADLRARGLSAHCVGNAMMDELEPRGLELELSEGWQGLALFPGSRRGAYTEMPRLLEVYRRVFNAGLKVRALVALADSIEPERLAASCPGWSYEALAPSGLVGHLRFEGLPPVGLVRRGLGDVLAASSVALGQAGTANEQAAGMGLPVVAYAPEGATRLGWYRGRQKGLLGDAVAVVEDDPDRVALEVIRLFEDDSERSRRAAIGRQRMGPPGASERIARVVESLVQ